MLKELTLSSLVQKSWLLISSEQYQPIISPKIATAVALFLRDLSNDNEFAT
jgi:hypothetical protein